MDSSMEAGAGAEAIVVEGMLLHGWSVCSESRRNKISQGSDAFCSGQELKLNLDVSLLHLQLTRSNDDLVANATISPHTP